MSLDRPGAVARALASRGYTAERGAVEAILATDRPGSALEAVVRSLPEGLGHVTTAAVRAAVDGDRAATGTAPGEAPGESPDEAPGESPDEAPGESPDEASDESPGEVSGDAPGGETAAGGSDGRDDGAPAQPGPTGSSAETRPQSGGSPDETKGVERADQREPSVDDPTGVTASTARAAASASPGDEPTARSAGGASAGASAPAAAVERSPVAPTIDGDVTGESTCTGEYGDFVRLFRDRYDRLAGTLRARIDHRPTDSLEALPGGADAGVVGLVNDLRTTAGGHRLVELEDTSGTFPCLVTTDRELPVDELVLDEVVAIEGTLADDGGVLFANELRFPEVPRRYTPATADRSVSAALISDVHVGSNEFAADAWDRFVDWLHTPAAADVEYLLIAGDMVEGVGVYPEQDEDLSIVDIYDQYEAFAEELAAVPADLEIVMIPGNHDAVRLAEPQPGFREDLREILAVHDATIVGNPSTVTVEGVSILLYHGVSLDEVIARLPDASYDAPAAAMTHLLKKRHLAPTFGGRTQIAPEHADYLVVDEVPDVFHAGHVHKLGVAGYHGVTVVNSGCWQSQTDFQRRNNIDPDYGYAPILDLETLDVTLRKFV